MKRMFLPSLMAFTAWLFSFMAFRAGSDMGQPFFWLAGLTGCIVITAAIYDWFWFRLPHVLTVPAAILSICNQAFWGQGWQEAILGSLLGFGMLKATQLLCRWRQGKECIGSGDAILMLSLGALIGPEAVPWGVGIAGCCGMATALLSGKHRLPFGPFLLTGCLVIFVYQHF